MLFRCAFFGALAATSLVSAAPVKQAAISNPIFVVLQFAGVLEKLESKFYEEALSKFQEQDFISAGYSSSQLAIQQIQIIQSDEQSHSEFIDASLQAAGQTPLEGCQFNFDSVLTDVNTMIATARAFEIVGIGAYLGGATLINDSVTLDAAGSILTVEARHSTMTNILAGASAIASSFDIPLSPPEVLSIASSFISGCDISPLGITPNPSLTITNQGSVQPGTQLTFKSDAINGSISEDSLSCQMIIGGATTAIVLPFKQCVVPEKVNGPVHVFITKDSQPLINNIRDRGVVLAGPAPAIIDSEQEVLSSLVKSNSSESVSTQTISPGAASSIISYASGSASSSASSTGTSTSGAPTGSAASNLAASQNGSSSGSGPNGQTGPSANGTVTVNGLSQVPAPQGSSTSAAPSSSSASSSGGGGY